MQSPLFSTSIRSLTFTLVLAVIAWTSGADIAAQRHADAVSVLQPDHVAPPTKQVDAATRARVIDGYGRLPLVFEANRGQTSDDSRFISRGWGYTLSLSATDAVLAVGSPGLPTTRTAAGASRTLRMHLVGANPEARGEGREQQRGRVNYLIGRDPSQWRTNLPTYARVSYDDVYRGVDLVYYGTHRSLEYDFVVAPGSDPGAIALKFEGADSLELGQDGRLTLQVAAGRLTVRPPRVYQDIDGTRRYVRARYRLMASSASRGRVAPGSRSAEQEVVRFDIGAYDRSRPLVIDPVLLYSTFLGAAQDEVAYGIAVDAEGSAYVTGYTASKGFPTTAGAFDPTYGGGATGDAFVTKFDPSGATLDYSTYLGGADFEEGLGVAVDSAGNAYVSGQTRSADFPITAGAFQTMLHGTRDAFVTKLAPSGATLVYSTYLGGTGEDRGFAITVDSSGQAFVTGDTYSSDFPTTPGAFDRIYGGGAATDVFVTKLAASGATLAYSTLIGGSYYDSGYSIAVDSLGSAYVTGDTLSADYPTTAGAFDRTYAGRESDAFVTKLAPSGASLSYSTYLGGAAFDVGWGIAVDDGGSAYVAGYTGSTDFPATAGAFDRTLGGARDAFVTKVDAGGSTLAYSTYLGGSGDENGFGIAIDSIGNAFVTGETFSSDFPTTPDAADTTYGGSAHADAFVTEVNASGAMLIYSTYLGGANPDGGRRIAVDDHGFAYVTGYTSSAEFPTVGAFDATLAKQDTFVTKIGAPDTSKADLIESAVSGPPAVVVLKQKFSVTDSARNQGGGTAAASTTRYYLSVDTLRSAGDKALSGKRAVPVLPGGATSTGTVTVTVPTNTKLGIYYLLACADDTNVVVETDESNNCRASATTTEVRAPDIVERSVISAPETVTRGGSVSITDTAANQGNAAAGASTTRYYLSLDARKSSGDTLLTGARAVPSLTVGATSTGTVTVTVPATTAPGSYWLLACGDDLKKVPESNEKNNCVVGPHLISVQ